MSEDERAEYKLSNPIMIHLTLIFFVSLALLIFSIIPWLFDCGPFIIRVIMTSFLVALTVTTLNLSTKTENSREYFQYKDFIFKGSAAIFTAIFFPLLVLTLYFSQPDAFDESKFKMDNSKMYNSVFDDTKVILLDKDSFDPIELNYDGSTIISRKTPEEFSAYYHKRILSAYTNNKIIAGKDTTSFVVTDKSGTYKYGILPKEELNKIGFNNTLDLVFKEIFFDKREKDETPIDKNMYNFGIPGLPFYIKIYDYTTKDTVFDIYNPGDGLSDKKILIKSKASITNRGAYGFTLKGEKKNRHFIILVVEADHSYEAVKKNRAYSRFALVEVFDKIIEQNNEK